MDLKGKLKKIETENEMMTTQLFAQRLENAKLKDEITTLKKEKTGVEVKLQELGKSRTPKSKVIQLRKQIKDMQKLNKVLNRRMQVKNTILRSIRLQNKRQQDKIGKLSDEKSVLEENNFELKENLSSKNNEIDTLSQTLQTTRTDLSNITYEKGVDFTQMEKF